jgi:hypothetical protein
MCRGSSHDSDLSSGPKPSPNLGLGPSPISDSSSDHGSGPRSSPDLGLGRRPSSGSDPRSSSDLGLGPSPSSDPTRRTLISIELLTYFNIRFHRPC